MKLSRILILVAFMLLCTAWLHADPVDPTHFFISLNNNGSDCFNGFVVGTDEACSEADNGGGWTGAVINGIVNPGCPDEGCPTDGSIFVTCDEEFGCHITDPSAGTRLGGKSEPITPTFSLEVDQFGGGATDFRNELGVPITTLQLNFFFSQDPPPGTQFTCDGGNAFDECGFIIDPADLTGSIIFSGGHVESSTVPEPSTWILLGTAALALVGRRAFRRA